MFVGYTFLLFMSGKIALTYLKKSRQVEQQSEKKLSYVDLS